MAIIEIGASPLSLLYHLIIFASSFLRFMMKIEMNKQLSLRFEKSIEFHPIFFLFFMFVSETSAGIWIVLQKKTKTEKQRGESAQLDNLAFVPLHSNKASMPKLFLFVFILFIFDFTSFFFGKYNDFLLLSANIIPQIAHLKISKDLFIADVLFLSLFGHLILHYPIFKHKSVSVVLFLIGGSFLICPYCFSDYSKGTTLYVIITAITYIIYSCLKTLEKIAMESRVILFNRICFYEGLLGIIMTVLISSFFYLVNYFKPNDTLKSFGTVTTIFIEFSYVFTKGFVLFLYFFLWIIASAFFNLLIRLVICNYTPMHTLVGETVSSLACCIYFIIVYIEDIKDKYYSIGGYLIVLLGVLINTEVIVLMFCNFELNTGIEISKRSDNEYKKAITFIEIQDLDTTPELVSFNN